LRRAGFTLCLALVCALGAGVTSVRADDAPPATPAVIADGVEVGTVIVGGMTPDQATQALLEAYLSPIELTVAGRQVSVSPQRFQLEVPVDTAVQNALAALPNTVVPLPVTLDATALSAYVDQLAEKIHRAPVPGRLVLRHQRPVATKGRAGLALARLPTRMLLRDALRDAVRAPIDVPIRSLKASAAPDARGPVIVIRRSSNRLLLFHDTRLVRAFPVATGQPAYPTPLGRFEIVVMWKNPTWYPPTQDAWAKGLKPVPPGPGNPLGTRWMGLSAPGVGIHGTDDPASIGYSLSHGCIRMQVPSAEWLFDHVTVGTPVFIVPS